MDGWIFMQVTSVQDIKFKVRWMMFYPDAHVLSLSFNCCIVSLNFLFQMIKHRYDPSCIESKKRPKAYEFSSPLPLAYQLCGWSLATYIKHN